MPTDRIKQFEQFHAEDPSDPFNIYALALEYRDIEPVRAQVLFDTLLNNHSDYLPTYYHAAQFFEALGQRDKAMEIFEKGIALAGRLKDLKTQRELRSAYDELLFE